MVEFCSQSIYKFTKKKNLISNLIQRRNNYEKSLYFTISVFYNTLPRHNIYIRLGRKMCTHKIQDILSSV